MVNSHFQWRSYNILTSFLGQTEEQQPVVQATRPSYSVGDRVKVCLDKDALMKLQQGHGGWNPRMTEYLTKVGTVHRITDKGDIRLVEIN